MSDYEPRKLMYPSNPLSSPRHRQPTNPDMLKVLISARDLISDPQNWLQGLGFSDAYGNATASVDDISTCKYCLTGAIAMAIASGPPSWKLIGYYNHIFTSVAGLVRESMPEQYKRLGEFNDASETQHSDILSLLDTVIKQQREMLACPVKP